MDGKGYAYPNPHHTSYYKPKNDINSYIYKSNLCWNENPVKARARDKARA